MTGDSTLTLKSSKLLPITLVLAGSMALAACSSKPSPWSESSSPWEGRAEQNAEPEPLAIEEIEPVPQAMGDTVEPVGFAEEGSPMAETEMVMEEPPVDVMEEPMVEETVMEESAPMAMSGSLADQQAGMFAVQVVASSSMDQLNFFAEQHQISTEWVAETTVDGKVWFVLMSGVYGTRDEAEQAMSGLQDLGTDPWVRSVGSVQEAMSR